MQNLKHIKRIQYFLLLLLVGNLCTGCFTDKDDEVQTPTASSIHDFIWKGLNAFYLYKEEVSDLQNDRFSSNEDYAAFLNGFTSPEEIFNALRTKRIVGEIPVDDFSFLVDDYVALEQAFDGITKNHGMEYGLRIYDEDRDKSDDEIRKVYGYVRYVLPNTDASGKGIERGYIFSTINGAQITNKNFRQLSDLDSYTLGWASFNNGNPQSNGSTVSLSKVQYTENPVFLTTTIDISGRKVGYLMYNSFTADFDEQLNTAFGDLKTAGITDLVLDLRYNGGGSVRSAIDLSSMITGQFKDQVFTTEQWNDDRQEQFGDTNRFGDQLRTETAINSLNLSEVYILTSRSSASASELVINALDPYITVKKVGTTTRGKFQASITLYDTDGFGRNGAELAGHTYAMQPLVLKSINSNGVTDYFAGFDPDIEIAEQYDALGVLGNENEPLLKAALDDITGAIPKFSKSSIDPFDHLKNFGDSKMFSPIYERMYKEN